MRLPAEKVKNFEVHKPQGFSFLGTLPISGISVILVLQLAPQALIPALPAVQELL